jgi:ABC-2 type transport system permease protein
LTQAFRTLVRRELGSHFLSLTGYVVIATVLLLLGFSFVDVLSKLNGVPIDATVTEIFYVTLYFWLILLLTTPVITMRTFALEKFTGTYETLMTTPVSDIEVVLAKFFGSLIFYAITWLPLLGYTFILQRYVATTTPALDPYTVATTFLGLVLVGALFIAMGCFASALTRSQLIAAALSYALGLTLFLLSLRSLVPMPAKDWEAELFNHIAMGEHMQDFARGVIELSSVTYYISMTAFFLFLTWRAVQSRRWN